MRPLGLFSARKPEPPGYAVHPGKPLVHGREVMPEVPPLVAPPVDREKARRPLRPGLPPLVHVPLPPPSAHQIAMPYSPPAERPTVIKPLISERPSFPVAAPPPAIGTPAPAVRSQEAASVALTSPAAGAAVQPTPVLRLDPLYAYLLYLALGLGTLYLGVLDLMERYTVLWVALIVLGVALMLTDEGVELHAPSPLSLGWGFGVGVVFSLPLMILISGGLADLSGVLFREAGAALRFQSLAIVGPLGETLFFRGVLQQRRGFAVSTLAAGLNALLFYWPAAAGMPTYFAAAVFFSFVLAGIYSFMRIRYGLSAALTCQITANLALFVVPYLLA